MFKYILHTYYTPTVNILFSSFCELYINVILCMDSKLFWKLVFLLNIMFLRFNNVYTQGTSVSYTYSSFIFIDAYCTSRLKMSSGKQKSFFRCVAKDWMVEIWVHKCSSLLYNTNHFPPKMHVPVYMPIMKNISLLLDIMSKR
jgi:hypothetical protein